MGANWVASTGRYVVALERWPHGARAILLAVVILVAALIAAACGPGSDDGAGDGASSASQAPISQSTERAGDVPAPPTPAESSVDSPTVDEANDATPPLGGVGVITTVAGFVREGDGGPATAAELDFPQGVALDGAGNLFIADAAGSNRIRRVAGVAAPVTIWPGIGPGR